jgi:hypothetical protein
MRQKRRIPLCVGGYKMVTQAILPPPQSSDSRPKVAYLSQTCKYACNDMFQRRRWTICGSHVTMSGFGANQPFLTPQQRVFERNIFNKIDEEASYLPNSSVKICPSVSCDVGNQKCTLYSKHALYKLWRTVSILRQ